MVFMNVLRNEKIICAATYKNIVNTNIHISSVEKAQLDMINEMKKLAVARYPKFAKAAAKVAIDVIDKKMKKKSYKFWDGSKAEHIIIDEDFMKICNKNSGKLKDEIKKIFTDYFKKYWEDVIDYQVGQFLSFKNRQSSIESIQKNAAIDYNTPNDIRKAGQVYVFFWNETFVFPALRKAFNDVLKKAYDDNGKEDKALDKDVKSKFNDDKIVKHCAVFVDRARQGFYRTLRYELTGSGARG